MGRVRRFADWSSTAKLIAVLAVGIVVGSALSSLGDDRAPEPLAADTPSDTAPPTVDGANTSSTPLATPNASPAPADTTNATIIRVIDGDTIKAKFGGSLITVRLIGVDTPETVDPSEPVECFGPAASKYTTRVLDGQRVRLEFDVERKDRYGRTLAYVWLRDGLFNEKLVKDGYATVATFPPNVTYVDRFLAAQRDARRHDRGLWGRCGSGGSEGSGGGGDSAGTGDGGGNCTSGYSPCLPSGPSDYDCYGGEGNGPAYTEPGVTYQVTGSDPYGLDADNDGFGCE